MQLIIALTALALGPSLVTYTGGQGDVEDHLYPPEAPVSGKLGNWSSQLRYLQGYALGLPRELSDDDSELLWAMKLPSFGPESGFSILRRRRDHLILTGTRLDQNLWSRFPKEARAVSAHDELRGGLRSEPALAVAQAARQDVETCEVAPLGPLGVRYVNAVNARLARTRVAHARWENDIPPPPPSVHDGEVYVFGGMTTGRTPNFPTGEDMERLRHAADMMLEYCFAPSGGTQSKLDSAVRALELSEPQ